MARHKRRSGRARDSALGREVAIKALPPKLAADAERVSFEREAQALAALQHPHIAGIHQLLEHDGARYLVLEPIHLPHAAGAERGENLVRAEAGAGRQRHARGTIRAVPP